MSNQSKLENGFNTIALEERLEMVQLTMTSEVSICDIDVTIN